MKVFDVIKKNVQPIIWIFGAFFLMVTISFVSLQGIVQRQLLQNAKGEILYTEETIKAKLIESEITLTNAAVTIISIVEKNQRLGIADSNEEVLDYLERITDWLVENDSRVTGFNGIYGYINNTYLDGDGWEPPEGFVATERPWYIAATESENSVAFTSPYIDALTKEIVLSVAMEVVTDNGISHGVIAIDIDISSLAQRIKDLELSDGGYGIMLDADLNILTHQDEGLIGEKFDTVCPAYATLSDSILRNEEISNLRITDVNGERVIVFFHELFNGCYMGVITPVESYNRDMSYTAGALTMLALILSVILSCFLIKYNMDKMKSDEESRSKSTFLARMSHEIRTPMNAIIGMSELMLRNDLPPNIYDNAVNIKNAGSNLLSLINDILDFSKIESGMLEIDSEEYDLPEIINDVMGIIRMRMTGNSVRLMIDINPNVPAKLIGDEVKIRQIMLNLLSNAVKYTKEGLIIFELSSENTGENSVMLKLNVRDSGIGIREDDLKKMFTNYMQFDTSRNKGIEGTGLGLAITHSFCVAMGGEINVESEYGKGTVFKIDLPQKYSEYFPFAKVRDPDEQFILFYGERRLTAASIVRSLNNLSVKFVKTDSLSEVRDRLSEFTHIFLPAFRYGNITAELKHLETQPEIVLFTDISEHVSFRGVHTLTTPAHVLSIANAINGVHEFHNAGGNEESFTAPDAKVLIVDDITANLLVAEGLLSYRGIKADIAKRGAEAIEMIKENRYDIVFMDHMMPEMDGVKATQLIRAIEGEYYMKLPIIALTANAVIGMREMFLESGMNDFIAKPIEPSKLDDMLRKWIPAEKINEGEIVIRDEKTQNTGDFFEILGKIPGISAERALTYAGGSDTLLEKNVRMIVGLLPESTEKLNELIKKDMASFAIQVHGVKNMLGNIGAHLLAESAQELEGLAKAGEREACLELGTHFLEDLSRLTKEMKKLLSEPEDKPIGDKELFYAALPKIAEASELFDSALALEILGGLNGFSYGSEIDKAAEQLTRAFERFDFDTVADLLNKLTDKK
ncbi:MAG: ATP-binding protein [Oscillospiraceae bacterium]|nr:ATP-binding protein [Oscillospiraceae bacterium]